jgi:hypothetical protein
MQVFNEVHNQHLNTSIGIVSVLTKMESKMPNLENTYRDFFPNLENTYRDFFANLENKYRDFYEN